MTHATNGYYIWHNNEFKRVAGWNTLLSFQDAYVAAVKSKGRTVYGVIKGCQWMSINKVDVPKELLAGMTLMGVPT
jgi:hypothetical protein